MSWINSALELSYQLVPYLASIGAIVFLDATDIYGKYIKQILSEDLQKRVEMISGWKKLVIFCILAIGVVSVFNDKNQSMAEVVGENVELKTNLEKLTQPNFEGTIWRTHLIQLETFVIVALFVDLFNRGASSPADNFKIYLITEDGTEVKTGHGDFGTQLVTDRNDTFYPEDSLNEKAANSFQGRIRGILYSRIDDLTYETVENLENTWRVTFTDLNKKEWDFTGVNNLRGLNQGAPTKAPGLKTILGSIEEQQELEE